jgi:hypothetical protein
MVPTQSWFLDLFSSRRPEPVERPEPRVQLSGTYRTLCVRLCDGFYAPVSASTIRSNFSIDAERCEKSCPGRSRLFVHRTGEEVESMVDVDGRPYSKLDNAFRHQREYVPDCTCRGNPWDEASLARHRAYAEGQQSQASVIAQKARTERARTSDRPTKRQRWARTRDREQDEDAP